jgi:phosphatidylglycerol:prolipoprotein diacylglycerol transferase
MIAFHLFGRPIYRYGIVYTSAFLLWYFWLYYIWKKINTDTYPWLWKLLTLWLDDVIFWIMLWVILWWRLWDVFLYNRSYYSQHLDQIIAIRNWWMSFVWGFVWVALVIYYFSKRYSLRKDELFLLFDYIVLILPLIIGFGRITNGLNQELYGKMINLWSLFIQQNYELLYNLKIIRIYDLVDSEWRWNTNLLESIGEWFLLFAVMITLFYKKLLSWVIKPAKITGLFCIFYWIIRLLLESLRDNPDSEYIIWILKSQLFMWWFIVLGIYLYFFAFKKK